MQVSPRLAKGAQTGVAFPATIESLLELGPDFLTRAFRATGAIGGDNRVVSITNSAEFYGGGMGRKLELSVEYANPESNLHRNLFLKFPRDFGDRLRDLFTPMMEPEVCFALLSRRQSFPVFVPKCYFGDYDAELVSGLLITARVPFGADGVEPAFDKCMDYKLGDPAPYFFALARAMGRLSGEHKAGRLGDVDVWFPKCTPTPTDSNRIPFSASDLPEKLDELRAFGKAAPQLFQDGLGSEKFLNQFAQDAPMVFALEHDLRAYLAGADDYIALCHTNMNVDNAWFWTNSQGEKQVGLLDWGGVAQMSLAQAIYGMLCSGELEFNRQYRRALVERVVNEYTQSGGPKISADTLYYMVRLSVAFLGFAWTLHAPSIIASVVPNFAAARDRFDPILRDNFLGRVQTQCLMVFLNEWRDLDIPSALRDFANGRRG